ncbi:hypothetical protein KQY27_00360 [Methanobrevibacter sp. TMH8]|uniref:UPF0146 family protein n=1 Tax=Methanobrevibacter sp. TMH8 TaxID=2848611 RepID=UPI001CCFC82D|nr:UPF0146 family protein [Methanobrevibacter sp. TMH8]MBZ9570011.1 hypothetical protein [Methanobrevibacter sp. TMH8]
MWDDLGEYIINHCNTKNINSVSNDMLSNKVNKMDSSCKVVEIAIGKFFHVSDYLKTYDSKIIEFTATDIDPDNSDITFDDITNPNMEIYNGADIIYSIRPPQELQPFISDIIKKTGAILIIKPLFNEDLNLNLSMKLINYKKVVFYQSI